MKKIITIICLVFSAIIILDSFNAWHVIAMFYIAGVIPGTRASINANTMMSFFSLLFGFVLARIGNKIVLALSDHRRIKQSMTHTQRA